MDILATALGKPDNPGRVVGVPGKVGAKKFFGGKRRTKPPKESQLRRLRHEFMLGFLRSSNHNLTSSHLSWRLYRDLEICPSKRYEQI